MGVRVWVVVLVCGVRLMMCGGGGVGQVFRVVCGCDFSTIGWSTCGGGQTAVLRGLWSIDTVTGDPLVEPIGGADLGGANGQSRSMSSRTVVQPSGDSVQRRKR